MTRFSGGAVKKTSERSLSSDRAEHLDVLDRARDPEIDIWRFANLLTRKHGVDTELEAARLADVMLDRGDR